jgi:hypothetical protein
MCEEEGTKGHEIDVVSEPKLAEQFWSPCSL